MAISRAERLLNLHILLLGARRFLDKESIRRACYPEHPDTDAGIEAFERAFERDKDALRAIGAVIEVGSADAYFDDELGYRIPSEQTSLPQIRFEADEAAVLGVAAQVWQDATLSRATSRALTKLKAQGVEIDPSRLEVIAPAIRVDEPAFEALWDAVQKHRQVSFSYHRAAESEAGARRVQPWGLVRSSGRWYLVGHDVDRGAPRVFRLSRIAGPVRATGRSGAFEVPAGTDVRALATEFASASPEVAASLRVRPGAGIGLRRRADSVVPGAEPGPDGGVWDRVTLSGAVEQLADEILTYGADVFVVEPEALVRRVVERLEQALEVNR
jgi:proteasome accessory factor B